jgi:hypothetical protein
MKRGSEILIRKAKIPNEQLLILFHSSNFLHEMDDTETMKTPGSIQNLITYKKVILYFSYYGYYEMYSALLPVLTVAMPDKVTY